MTTTESAGHSWLFYAFASALSAGSIGVLGKLGMSDMNSDAATALRSIVQASFAVGIALYLGVLRTAIPNLTLKSGLSITAAGIAGGMSWIFMFRALKLADNARVLPIDKLSMPIGVLLAFFFLHEKVTATNWAGIALIAAGAYMVAHKTA